VQGAGFSLVEVLVAVLVLSIGLLGLAALQIAGVRANDSAQLRTEATLAASDIADRMRADPAAFFPLGQDSKGTVAIAPGACGGDHGGTADALGRWRRDFCALGLPPPSSGDFARVDCRDANACGSGNCTIVIRWDDRRGDRRGAEESETGESTIREFRFCTRIATAI
jgi:type IV pilus assembly protein PilV